MTRTTDNVVKTGTQSADDPMTFVLSDETVDSMGDIVRAKGWDLSRFKGAQANPIALFGHDHGFPVGTWKNVRVDGKRLLGELKLAAAGTSERIDEIRSLVEQRVLRAVSVGFSIKDYDPIDKNEPFGGWDIKKALLHETSLVSVPANPSAVAVAKSMGISRETRELIFAGQLPTHQRSQPVGNATSSNFNDLLGTRSDELRAARRFY